MLRCICSRKQTTNLELNFTRYLNPFRDIFAQILHFKLSQRYERGASIKMPVCSKPGYRDKAIIRILFCLK
ncbi:hypothetical protein CAMRE0001_1400 [Campylobacter rectus RM3267]|uniref:Uncharacterized protein n=1 Tax=Campylobacter rectus RM3267 TaxID=553218 RepID=B9D083_CAMRE|nr:hypothetical protein CAMRE0001_1400 [Campylobacter rectus RM3267]